MWGYTRRSSESLDLMTQQGPFGGWTVAALSDGRTLTLDADGREGRLRVSIDGGGHVDLPYPRRGYGGHEFVVAPGERVVAIFLYSGQSEIGYELFSLEPSLAHLRSCPYRTGAGDVPVFSPDARLIGLAWTVNGRLVPEADLSFEEAMVGPDERLISPLALHWATLRVEDVATGDVEQCEVHVRVPAGWPMEPEDDCEVEEVRVEAETVSFHPTDGDTVRLARRLPERVTVEAR